MTNAEAIEILKRKIHDPVPKAAVGAKKENEAIHMAISALEKREQKKPLTNADRIRAMTDEELSELFDSWVCDCECNNFPCQEFCEMFDGKTCCKRWLEWLKQEVN